MTDTPELTHEQVAEIAQEHEAFLTQLESLAITALASGNWWPVQDLISEVETWQGEQALREANEKQTEDLEELKSVAVAENLDSNPYYQGVLEEAFRTDQENHND